MKFWTIVKCLSAAIVLGVLALACMLAWHVMVAPLGAFFEQWIPASAGLGSMKAETADAAIIEEESMPDVDPGEFVYEAAREELAMGHIQTAREKLDSLVQRFPQSGTATQARRILSEMNLDDLLSLMSMRDKQVYQVKAGDSYLAIAAREKTTLENMLHLNAMLKLPGLRPGDELILMPLENQVVIDSQRKTISIWKGDLFLCDFPIQDMPRSILTTKATTVVESKSAYLDGKRVLPESNDYAAATKSLVLKEPKIRIEGAASGGEAAGAVIALSSPDMEELNLLVRSGNSVTFR